MALLAGFICQGTLLAQGPVDCPISAAGPSSAQVLASGSINSFLVNTTKAGCAYSIQLGAIGPNADLSAIHLTNAASGVTQAGLPVLIDYQIDANATSAARHFSLTFVITATNRLQFNIDQDGAGTPTFYIHCPILYGPTTVGVPYYNYCNHVGGTYPYTGSVTSSPPAGVTAHLDGTDFDITGTPTAPGPYNFTINMSDSVGHTASQTFSGTVVSPPVVSCNPSTGPAVVGVAWSSTCTATGGTPPYNWFIPPYQTTPAGLTLNPTSGQAVTLSVTPSAAGYYNWQITALDSEPGGGIQATGYFMGQIASAATSCQTPLPVQSVSGVLAPPLGGDQDVGIQFTLVGCNWNITTNTPWLSITGPSSGTTAANVVLTKYHAQANPGNTTRHGTLIISVPPSITTPVDISQDGSGCVLAINPSGVQVPTSGGKGTFTVTTTPSTCVPTFTVESPWLTISGPVGNVYTYTATANAGAGRIGAVLFVPPGGGNQGFLFSVTQDGPAPALSVSCTRISDSGVGLPFEVDCTASGGLPPYQFSTIGTLPGGTAGAASGATYKITGIITSSAIYDFTVIATDANQQPANSRLSGFVKPAPLVISCSSAAGPASTTPFTLTCTPVAGVAPYTWNISAGALPTGLSAKQTSTGSSFTVSGTPSNAGSYAFTIQVADANSSIATQSFSGTIISVKVTLSVSPFSVSLTYRFGDPPPQPTILQISSAPSNVSFQASVANAPWLLVSSPGQTPATINLNINPAALTPGVYNTTLLISAPDATPPSLQIPVSLTLINPLPPQLSVAPHRLFLTVAQGSPDLTKQVAISNLGGGSLDYSFAVPNTSWLTITNTTGHLSTAGPASLQFVIHPAGLASGAYSSQLNVATTNGTQHTTVEVDLAVEPSSPSLALSQSGVQLVAAAGAGPATSAAIQVLNTGSGTLHWTAETAIASRTPGWLQLSAASGIATGSTALHIDASQLAPGQYSGRVIVKSSDSLNSPVSASVLLTVVDPAQSPAPLAAPSGVTISGQSSTSITLTNFSSKALNFTATASTDDATNWLSVSSGPASVAARQTLSVTLNATTNTSSARRGSVRFAFDDGSFAMVSVLQLASSSCTATKLVPLFTTLPSGFAAKTGQPEALSLSLYDDCGNPISSGGVSLTFTNGDPDLALQSLGSGIWTGTWVPRSNGARRSALSLSPI